MRKKKYAKKKREREKGAENAANRGDGRTGLRARERERDERHENQRQ